MTGREVELETTIAGFPKAFPHALMNPYNETRHKKKKHRDEDFTHSRLWLGKHSEGSRGIWKELEYKRCLI